MERRMAKIAFFSEGGFTGVMPRDNPNLRMPEVWYASLGAMHHPINQIHTLPDNEYDLGIIIIPKNLHHLLKYPLIENIKRVCKKTAFQQEGASWIFQDYEVDVQVWFYTLMMSMDFGLCHNDSDKEYYEGILEIPIYIQPTLLLDDPLKNMSKKETSNKVIVGGNLVRYYGGFNSYLVAQEFKAEIWAPSMGRKKTSESRLEDLNHLPWMVWNEWMVALSEMKYAVHLNPNTIAGSFYLNCAYWGIPCIGNINTDTQRICFPDLSIEPDNLKEAKNLAKRLRSDEDFYFYCSNFSKNKYKEHFSEEVYKSKINKILKAEL